MIAIIGTIMGATIFSGCVQSGTGQLTIKITDDPDLNITKANVTFSKVQVHLGVFGNNESENETNGTAGWYTVINTVQTFDLIALQNVTAIWGNATLTAGWYTQIRLYVDKAVITIDGVEHNCTIPSNVIKLIKPFNLSANATTTLILDFDVQKSIHETGAGEYIFKPTIKVTQE